MGHPKRKGSSPNDWFGRTVSFREGMWSLCCKVSAGPPAQLFCIHPWYLWWPSQSHTWWENIQVTYIYPGISWQVYLEMLHVYMDRTHRFTGAPNIILILLIQMHSWLFNVPPWYNLTLFPRKIEKVHFKTIYNQCLFFTLINIISRVIWLSVDVNLQFRPRFSSQNKKSKAQHSLQKLQSNLKLAKLINAWNLGQGLHPKVPINLRQVAAIL